MEDTAAREARKRYKKEWAKRNREKVNEYARKWRAKNPDKVAKIQETYWTRRAQKGLDDDNNH